MLVIVAPVLVFSGIYTAIGTYFLLSYYRIPHLRSRHMRWFILTCFFYAAYNGTRVGMYTSFTADALAFWIRMAHILIPILSITIAGFLSHYVKDEQQWIMKYFYAVFALLALAVACGGRHLFVIDGSIAGTLGILNASIPRLRGDGGIIAICLYGFLLFSVLYFFFHVIFWGVRGERKEIAAMLSGVVVLFGTLAFDIGMSFKPLPFIFLGEYGFFFLMLAICYSFNSQIAFHWKDRPARTPKGNPDDLLKDVDIESVKARLLTMMQQEKAFSQENLSLEVMARQLSLSAAKLSRFMNAVMESDFRNFINQFRIEEAKRLLATRPELSVKHICYEVGFQSASTFHDAFKKFTGTTPAKFRKDNSA